MDNKKRGNGAAVRKYIQERKYRISGNKATDEKQDYQGEEMG